MSQSPPFIQSFVDFIMIFIRPLFELVQELSSFEFYNNSGLDYALVPVIFISILLGGYIAKYVIVKKVEAKLMGSSMKKINPVVKRIRSLINFTNIFIVAFYFSTQHLVLGSSLQLFFNIFIFGALIYAVYKFGSGLIDTSIEYRDQSKDNDESHILSFVSLLGKVAVASILALWYLTLLGINVTTLAAGLGIAGITIAFALQNIVADLFAAVAIYLDKPFEIGDYINVNDRVGRIEKIGVRSTHIRSIDGPLIVMSNQNLTQADIINYKKMDERRVQQVIGIGADTPVDILRELPNEIEKTIEDIPDVRVDKIWLKELGDFSWNFELIYFVDDPSMARYREVQQEINYRVLELMESKDVEIPYPIQEIILSGKETIREPLQTGVNQAKNNSN